MDLEKKLEIELLVDDYLAEGKVLLEKTGDGLGSYHFLLLALLWYRKDCFITNFWYDDIYGGDDGKYYNLPDGMKRDGNFEDTLGTSYATSSSFDDFDMFIEEFENHCWDDDFGGEIWLEYLDIFAKLDRELLQSHFPNVFDVLLERLVKMQPKSAGLYMLPYEVNRLISSLIELPKGAKVYHPYFGLGPCFVKGDSIIYKAQDIEKYKHEFNKEKNNWSYYKDFIREDLSLMRLDAYGIDNCNYNIFETYIGPNDENKVNWNPEGEKYDLIISNTSFYTDMGDMSNRHQDVIEKGLGDLTKNGQIIAVVPSRFTTSGKDSLKQDLVDRDLLDTVISFPSGLLTYTSAAFSILLIKKHKKRVGSVKFVNATNFIQPLKEKRLLLDDQALYEVCQGTNENEHIKIIPIETIKKDNYNLNVARYSVLSSLGEPLSKFCEIYRGTSIKDSLKGKYVRIKELKDDPFDHRLDLDRINDSEIPKDSIKVSRSCLLVASVGQKLKPTYFDHKGKDIYINKNVRALEIDSSMIDVGYLVHQLYSDHVAQQLQVLRLEATIPHLSNHNLMKIRVELPSPDGQKLIVESAKKTYLQGRERELELERELLGLKEGYKRDFQSIRHTMNQYLNALKSNVGGTLKFIKKNQGNNISLESIYSKNLNQSFGDHLKSLDSTIGSMSRLLDDYAENNVNLKSEIISLKEIVKEAQNRFKDPERFKFEELFIDHDSFSIDQGYLDQYIEFDREDFFSLFSNIVSNAVDHGFDPGKSGHVIRTSIKNSPETKEFVLEISNNGKPFPEGFTFADLVTKGEKATDSKGTGMGGADIKYMLSRYNAKFELENNAEDLFPVKYIIYFPQKTIADLIE